jgi:enoyl-[acyl-carrier protein] reductase II
MERNGASVEELEAAGAGKLRLAVVDGDIDNGSVMSGQIAGMIKDIKSCRDIIEGMVQEAMTSHERIRQLSGGGLDG